MMEEVQLFKDKEILLSNRLQEREDEIFKLASKLSHIEEQLKIKETQCRHSENEIKRNSEQYFIDVESFNLQIELLQKNLNEKKTAGFFESKINTLTIKFKILTIMANIIQI